MGTVCRGHELANALYFFVATLPATCTVQALRLKTSCIEDALLCEMTLSHFEIPYRKRARDEIVFIDEVFT